MRFLGSTCLTQFLLLLLLLKKNLKHDRFYSTTPLDWYLLVLFQVTYFSRYDDRFFFARFVFFSWYIKRSRFISLKTANRKSLFWKVFFSFYANHHLSERLISKRAPSFHNAFRLLAFLPDYLLHLWYSKSFWQIKSVLILWV